MFYSSGYFKHIDCPFLISGLCERPHCHFRHSSLKKVDSFQSTLIDNEINSTYSVFDNNYLLSIGDREYNPVDYTTAIKPSYSPAVTPCDGISYVNSESRTSTRSIQTETLPNVAPNAKTTVAIDTVSLNSPKSNKIAKINQTNIEIVDKNQLNLNRPDANAGKKKRSDRESINESEETKIKYLKKTDSSSNTSLNVKKITPIETVTVNIHKSNKIAKTNQKNIEIVDKNRSNLNRPDTNIRKKKRSDRESINASEESKIKYLQKVYKSIFESSDEDEDNDYVHDVIEERKSSQESRMHIYKKTKVIQQPVRIERPPPLQQELPDSRDDEFKEMEDALVSGRWRGRRITTTETLQFRMRLANRDRDKRK